MNEIYAYLMTRIFIATIIAGIITVIICFILNAVVMPFTTIKGVEKAKKEGRMILARYVKIFVPYGTSNFDQGVGSTVDVLYEYEYKGKTYKYKHGYSYNVSPEHELTLYFRNNPAKARPANQYGRLESEWKIIFLVLTIISFVVTFFIF